MRGGQGAVGVRAQVGVGLRAVMVGVMCRVHVRGCVWASERVTVRIAMRAGVWVAVCVRCRVWVRAVWTGAAAVGRLPIPVGGAAVVGRVILREVQVFLRGAVRGTQCGAAVGCYPG